MPASTQTAPELTREQVATILTQPLEQRSVFLAAGPRIFDTDGNTLRIPRAPEFDPADITWTGENEQIGEADFDEDELALLPSTMKSLKVITRYSNELARQSVVSLDAALRDRLVSDVAGKLDAQLLSAGGDGTTTPQGMFAWAGTQSVDVAGPLSLDAILDAQALALSANADVGRMVLLVRPDDYMTVRGVKEANSGRYLVEPNAQAGGTIVPLLGARVLVSSRIPAGNAALVDMAQVAVARDLAPSVKVLTERYADYDQQAIRVVSRYDAGPLNAAAVVKLTGITDAAA